MATMIWCVTGCRELFGYEPDNRTFDELPVIEFDVINASLYPNPRKDIPSPYILYIDMRRITGGGRQYEFYSDEKCTNRISGNMLVTAGGLPPSESNSYISSWGSRITVYLNYHPKEGDKAKFYQDWFFAKATENPSYREKVRIITESMVIVKAPSSVWENAESED
jgi:hypothetical protein